MYIGNLRDPASGISVASSFYKSNTTIPLPPDIPADKSNPDSPLTGWSWDSLLAAGVDVALTFGEKQNRVWISRIVLRQEGRSAIEKVTLLRWEADGALVPVGRTHTEQTLTGDVTVDAGCFADELIVRIETDYFQLQLSDIEVIGAVFDEPVIFPVPEKSSLVSDEKIAVSSLRAICARPDDTDAVFAAGYLKDLLADFYAIHVEIVSALPADLTGMIVIERDTNAAEDSYRLQTANGCCRITAHDRRGMLYAAAVLAQLAQSGEIPAVDVDDKPFMAFRGVHIGLPDREHIPFLKRVLKYLIIPMRYNALFIEIAAGMRYDRHPEINEAWLECKRKYESGEWPIPAHYAMTCKGTFLEKAEVRDIFEYAEELGLEAIPEIHSLSHMQYLTKAFPQIAEIPAHVHKEGEVDLLADDGLNNEFYPSCYCPSNEESYRILFDILDEVIETVHPKRYFHMGHDEVYRIGVCEKCREKDPAKLYADDVTRIHDYLAEKGLTMMMWCDMLHTVTKYKTPPAIDMIPKDIIMLDFIWYFHFDLDIEERILDHGFTTMIGNLYSSHFPRFEKRIRQKGIIGGQISTWVGVTEEAFALEGKMYDLVFTANMLWSEAYRSESRSAYDYCVAELLRRVRPLIHGDAVCLEKTYRPISLDKAEKSCALSGRERTVLERWTSGWAKDSVQFGSMLHAASPSAAAAGCSSHEIPVDSSYDGLLFVQACDGAAQRIPWAELKKIGEYVIHYADGGAVSLPIEYGGSTAEWNRRYAAPLKSPYFRHEGYLATYTADPIVRGKTESGDDFTLYGWEWRNPEPERRISSITFSAADDAVAGTYLFALSGCQEG